MKILVAEDERDIRNLIKFSLEENGYNVLTAKDGKEAWSIIQLEKIDLAVLDVMMPMLDGFNLLKRIRDISTVPVIFLTARTDEIDKVIGLGLGADDYLGKPFSTSELVARVAAQLRRSNEYLSKGSDNSTQVTYKDLTIDKDKCCVYKKGELIEIGAKEYKLLLFFMEHPEKIYTKLQLYQEVWEGNYYYDDNTIMVHISRIRNKIEDDPHNPIYIKTIRGIGYKLHDTRENI